MTNPKIEKVKTDMEKIKAKISEHQAKLRDLEREKTRLEDMEIVALVRGERISDAELATLMQSLRRTDSTEPVKTTALVEGKLRQEELRDANTDEN
jgi:septal ring factor EnvC (AmiA/AmiB activator)